MIVIRITIIIQIIISIMSIVYYYNIKNSKENKLYFHEKKSFQDTYKMNAEYTWIYFLIFYFGAIVSDIYKSSILVMTLIDWIIVLSAWGIVTLMVSVMISISLYMITEIKHISQEDGIGIHIYKIKDDRLKKEIKRFYMKMVIMGLFVYISIFIQMIYIHLLLGVEFILISIIVYTFGMADVLQHDDYNTSDYKARLKKMKWIDRLFIGNIIRFFKNEEYHNNAIKILHENTNNIKKGIISIFR